MRRELRHSTLFSYIWAEDYKNRLFVRMKAIRSSKDALQLKAGVEYELNRIAGLNGNHRDIDMIYELEAEAGLMRQATLSTFIRGATEILSNWPNLKVWVITNFQSPLWTQLMWYIPSLGKQIRGVFSDPEELQGTIDRLRGFAELEGSNELTEPQKSCVNVLAEIPNTIRNSSAASL